MPAPRVSPGAAIAERRESCRREQRLSACLRLHSAQCQTQLEATAALTGRLGRLAGDRAENGEVQPGDGQTVCMVSRACVTADGRSGVGVG